MKSHRNVLFVFAIPRVTTRLVDAAAAAVAAGAAAAAFQVVFALPLLRRQVGIIRPGNSSQSPPQHSCPSRAIITNTRASRD